MEEPQLAEAAPHMVRAMAPGISAAFGTLLSGRQDRKNLEADRAVVEGMLQTGLTSFRYRGIAMEFELFADENQEEIERLVVSQPRNSSCFRRDLDKQEIAIARLLPKNTFDFKHD